MWNFSTQITEEAVKKNGVNLGTVVADSITKQLHSDLQSIPVSIVISTISQKMKRKEKKRKKDKLPLPSKGIACKIFDS